MNASNWSLINVSVTLSSNSAFLTELTVGAWYAAMVALAAFGTFNNLLILIIIAMRRKLHSGSGFLIAHLVAVYLLVCIVHAPVNAFMVYSRHTSVPANVCSSVQFFFLATVYASNWTEACLALNRFVAIQFPHNYTPWTRKRVTVSMILFCWLFGIGASLPSVFGKGGQFLRSNLGQCYNNAYGTLGSWLIVSGTYLPYGLVGVLYSWVVGRMVLDKLEHRRVTSALPASITHTKISQVVARRMGVARMLVVSFLWCCLCNMPLTVLASGFPQIYSSQPFSNLWVRLCLIAQFALNPLIFYAMNDDYRDGVRDLLRKCRRKHIGPATLGQNASSTPVQKTTTFSEEKF